MSIVNDETHNWRRPILQVLPASYFVTPAGGETATTTMGDTSNGDNRQAEADTSNPGARTFNTTTANDPGNDPGSPWFAVSRALFPARYADPKPRTGAGESQLEVVESDMPILAHRVAKLCFAGNGKHWGAVSIGGTFGVDADAECHGGMYGGSLSSLLSGDPYGQPSTHKPPAVDCTCGFYATPLGKAPYSTDSMYVRLLVELSGDVIECEYLYRSGHQRVIECQIPRCVYCGKPSKVIDVRDGEMQNAACGLKHLECGKKGVRLGIDDLASLLPVPVTAAEPLT